MQKAGRRGQIREEVGEKLARIKAARLNSETDLFPLSPCETIMDSASGSYAGTVACKHIKNDSDCKIVSEIWKCWLGWLGWRFWGETYKL